MTVAGHYPHIEVISISEPIAEGKRGMEDILIACTDNLTGFSSAIKAVFSKTEVQNCFIHHIRNSTKYVSYKDLKALVVDLKAVYAAVLDVFAQRWDKKYPKTSVSWQDNWPNLRTYFKFPQEVRRLILRALTASFVK